MSGHGKNGSRHVNERDIGRRLRVLMLDLKLSSVKKLAEFMGVGDDKRSQVSNWVNGYHFPQVESIWNLTRKAGVTLDWLYGGDINHLSYSKAVKLTQLYDELLASEPRLDEPPHLKPRGTRKPKKH